MNAVLAVDGEGPLAIICGGGSLPLTIADLVTARGRPVVMFPLYGAAEPQSGARYPHHWVHVGQLGRFTRLARAAGCRDVVFIGSLVRPALWQLRLDWTTLTVLPRVAAAYRGGDDHLLTGVARVFEGQGFRMLGAHQVAPEILVPEGAFGRAQPSQRAQADIAFGLDYLRAAGPFDIGQAWWLRQTRAGGGSGEGTDAMLTRVAQLRANGRIREASGGVLVKAPKPAQDRRFDLPSIGPQTIEGAARAGLSGVAVVAGETVVAEPEALLVAADRANIFVIGVPAGPAR